MKINSKTFSFQTSFNINDDQYEIKVSSNKLEDQEKQVITLMKNTDGVNMVKRETMTEDPEFLLTGEGLMENASEEELKNFAEEWLRLVGVGSLRGIPCLGICSLEELLAHFFPGPWVRLLTFC